MGEIVTIHINQLFEQTGTAKLAELASYCKKAVELAGEGHEIILTGAAPVWLYLSVSHALHGKVRKLSYNSPVTGEVVIYDHNPF